MLALWLQILEDMEREFGIKCPPGHLKDQHQEDCLDLEKCDSALRGSMEEQSTISQLEEEKNKVGKALLLVIYKGAKNMNWFKMCKYIMYNQVLIQFDRLVGGSEIWDIVMLDIQIHVVDSVWYQTRRITSSFYFVSWNEHLLFRSLITTNMW